MSEPLLAVRGVKRFYGNIMAMKGVALDVHPGDGELHDVQPHRLADLLGRQHHPVQAVAALAQCGFEGGGRLLQRVQRGLTLERCQHPPRLGLAQRVLAADLEALDGEHRRRRRRQRRRRGLRQDGRRCQRRRMRSPSLSS